MRLSVLFLDSRVPAEPNGPTLPSPPAKEAGNRGATHFPHVEKPTAVISAAKLLNRSCVTCESFRHHVPGRNCNHSRRDLNGNRIAGNNELSGAIVAKSIRMSDSLAKVIARLERLPSLPALYNQVTAELAKPDASIAFVGRLISMDPAMATKVLQLVNSTVFAMPTQITDPGEAVMQLGVERTKTLILAARLMLDFEKVSCPGFSHDQLWRHSMAVAAFSRAITLAHTKTLKLSEMAFTAGLLHDVGKLLLAANFSETYGQVLEQAERRKISVLEVELEAFDTTHPELAAALLGSWGLPAPILEAIHFHHCPENSAEKGFSSLTAVHVANAVEHEKVLAQSGGLVNQINIVYLTRLGLLDRCKVWREICGFKPRTQE